MSIAFDGERIDPQEEWQQAYLADSEARAGDRWTTTLYETGGAFVWLVTVTPALDALATDQAILEILEWTGVRIDGGSDGDGYDGHLGTSYGTMDYGLGANEIRVYRRHGVVVFAVAEVYAEVGAALSGLRVGPPPTERKKGRAPKGIPDLCAHFVEAQAPALAGQVGPNFRVLWCFAMARASGDTMVRFRVRRGDEQDDAYLTVFGSDERMWMFAAHNNPPGDVTLEAVLEEMSAEAATGWAPAPGSFVVERKFVVFDPADANRLAEAALTEAFAWRKRSHSARARKKVGVT